MDNSTLQFINSKLGFTSLSQILYYAIYGVDRCKVGSEYSWILLDYQVEEAQLGEYFAQVLGNIALLQLISLAILYLKLNSLSQRRRRRKTSEKNELSEAENEKANLGFNLNENESKRNEAIEMKERQGMVNEEERKFHQFSANKILIAWRSLSLFRSSSLLEVPSGKEKENPILRQLNGEFRFGSLNALMGTSGAGKTSLLKVLNGRCKTRLSDESRIYLSKYTRITSCFITQDVSGHLMRGLTAKQMLIFASKLKNPQASVDHEAIALKWLGELDLLNTRETKVERCSGGERKRLAVALELTALAMPNCVCIDEPTSGLDTNSAEIVISTLRRLTRTHPITIITSIHQPTTEVLHLFDSLYVLARGGLCIFSGPPTSLQSHLSLIPGIIPEGSSHFPIETLIKYSCSSSTVRKLVHQTTLSYQSPASHTQLFTQTTHAPDGLLRNRLRFSLHSTIILAHRYAYFLRGYLWRFWLVTLLNSLGYPLTLRLIFNPSMIHVSGCINLEEADTNQCTKSATQIADQFAIEDNFNYSNFYTSIYMILLGFGSLLNLHQELPYFINEHRNGWYSTGSFYLMKLLYELLPLICSNLLYVYIINIYDPILAPDRTLYWSLFTLLTLAAIGFTGFAQVCALALPGPEQIPRQTLLYIGLFIFHLILSNYRIPLASVHYVYQALSKLSILRPLLQAVLLLQYGFGRCSPKEISGVLYAMSVTEEDFYPDLISLLINLLFYRLLAIYLLTRLVSPIENRRQRASRIAQYQEKGLGTQLASGLV